MSKSKLYERMPPYIIDKYQLNKINKLVEYCKNNSSYYNETIYNFPKIKDFKDFSKLPFTDSDIVSKFGSRLVCISQSDISKVSTIKTSGTSQVEKRIFFSSNDIENTINYFERGLSQFIMKGTKTLIMMPCERKNSVGDLISRALEKIESKAYRVGLPQNFKDMNCNIGNIDYIIGMPITVLAFGRYLKHIGKDINLKGILLSGDALSPYIYHLICSTYKLPIYRHYGLTESGLGCAVDCRHLNGMHVREDDLYVEIIDPLTLKELEFGQEGEIVITTLNREAMPLIRYRTGDIGKFISGDCPCGSNFKRLDYIKKRLSDNKNYILRDLDIKLFKLKNLLDYKVEISSRYILFTLVLLDHVFNKKDFIYLESVLRYWSKNKEPILQIVFSDDYMRLHRAKRSIVYKNKD